MAELRRHYPERIEAERQIYEEYAPGRTEVIDLSSTTTETATTMMTPSAPTRAKQSGLEEVRERVG